MTEPISVVISALIAALISILTGFFTISQNAKKFYAEKSAMDRKPWIDEMREYCVELLTICALYSSEEQMTKEERERFEKARQRMLVRLNPIGMGYAKDDALFALLTGDFAKVKQNGEQIRRILAEIIKHERDKFRIESGRTKNMKKKIKSQQD